MLQGEFFLLSKQYSFIRNGMHPCDILYNNCSRCLERGFNSAKLLCSSCQDLKQFELGAVMADCEACCTDDGGASTLDNVKYERAILEVCG